MSAGIADRAADEGRVRPGDASNAPAGDTTSEPPGDEPRLCTEAAADVTSGDDASQAPVSELAVTPAGNGMQADLPSHARALSARANMSTTVILAAARWTKWFERELLGLSMLVGPGSVCVDVGAAAGIYTLPLSRLAGPSGLVYSVEPLPFAWPAWNRLFNVRNSPNVRHHAVALGSEPGQASMRVPMGRFGLVTGRSFISQHCCGLGSNAEFARHISFSVPVTTLDGLLAGSGQHRLDFVKIDVEGAELHVLHGGQGVIESFRPAMLIEIEARHTSRYEYDPEDVVSWLCERGYTMYVWDRGWQEASKIISGTRNYLFQAR